MSNIWKHWPWHILEHLSFTSLFRMAIEQRPKTLRRSSILCLKSFHPSSPWKHTPKKEPRTTRASTNQKVHPSSTQLYSSVIPTGHNLPLAAQWLHRVARWGPVPVVIGCHQPPPEQREGRLGVGSDQEAFLPPSGGNPPWLGGLGACFCPAANCMIIYNLYWSHVNPP